MTEAVAIARDLPAAANPERQRELIGRLRKALASSEAAISLSATMKDGRSVAFQQAGDIGAIETLSLTIDEDGTSETVGPFRPVDAEGFFDLFLE